LYCPPTAVNEVGPFRDIGFYVAGFYGVIIGSRLAG